MSSSKSDLDATVYLSRASQDTHGLDAWINQHLAIQEERMWSRTPNGASPFAWHKPSANDLMPSNKLELNSNTDALIQYTKD